MGHLPVSERQLRFSRHCRSAASGRHSGCRENSHFSGKLLGSIAAIAVPSILQQSFISIGNIMIQSVINRCGVGVTAGYAAAIKLNNLVTTSFTTLGNGISNYTAQNLGAGLGGGFGRASGQASKWCGFSAFPLPWCTWWPRGKAHHLFHQRSF